LRAMAVLDPVKVIVTNYPEEQVEELDAENNPEDESAGKRKLPFARELYIERSDFMENPPKKFFRLGLEREVRLKHAYYITCTDFIKNEKGEVTEIHCTYDPATKGGWSDDGRKVRGTLHWVSAKHAVDAEVRFYDHLFNVENPETDGDDFIQYLNPNSLIKTSEVKLEIGLQGAAIGTNYQFLRNGYFCLDLDSTEEKLIFNRTVGLRDSWSKKQKV